MMEVESASHRGYLTIKCGENDIETEKLTPSIYRQETHHEIR